MRIWEISTLVLFLVSSGSYIGMVLDHPVSEVGILLVDELDLFYGEEVQDGFSTYNDHFSARVLDHRFNSSQVRTRGNFFLNSDFFRLGQIDEIKDEYDVDIVLIITSEMIQDWDESGKGYWGQANTRYGAALMTVHYWMGPGQDNASIWLHIALHEVFHLLGYTHNPWDDSGIMQYADNLDSQELSFYYELQLPIRSTFYLTMMGASFNAVVFFMNLILVLFLFPILMGQELILRKVHERITKTESLPVWLSILSNMGCLMIAFSITGSLMVFAVTLLFAVLVHFAYGSITIGHSKRSPDKERGRNQAV